MTFLGVLFVVGKEMMLGYLNYIQLYDIMI